jgi:hypothetical protein
VFREVAQDKLDYNLFIYNKIKDILTVNVPFFFSPGNRDGHNWGRPAVTIEGT